MGPLGELGALFNPGMRHELEERRAKQMLREEEGTGRKGDLRIDLESGVAVIAGRRAGDHGTPAEAGDDDHDPALETSGDGDDGAGDDGAGGGDDVAAVDTAGDGDDTAGKHTSHAKTRQRDGRQQPAQAPRDESQLASSRSAGTVPSGKARRAAGGPRPLPSR